MKHSTTATKIVAAASMALVLGRAAAQDSTTITTIPVAVTMTPALDDGAQDSTTTTTIPVAVTMLPELDDDGAQDSTNMTTLTAAVTMPLMFEDDADHEGPRRCYIRVPKPCPQPETTIVGIDETTIMHGTDAAGFQVTHTHVEHKTTAWPFADASEPAASSSNEAVSPFDVTLTTVAAYTTMVSHGTEDVDHSTPMMTADSTGEEYTSAEDAASDVGAAEYTKSHFTTVEHTTSYFTTVEQSQITPTTTDLVTTLAISQTTMVATSNIAHQHNTASRFNTCEVYIAAVLAVLAFVF